MPERYHVNKPWVTGVLGVYQGPLQIIHGVLSKINLCRRVSMFSSVPGKTLMVSS